MIRTSIALALRAFSVLILLAGIYGLIEILKASFRLPTEGTIGGLMLAIVFSAAVLAVMQILLCRADWPSASGGVCSFGYPGSTPSTCWER